MAKLLFSLRGVPADEAFEVRELLTAHDILFYETSAGNWGISTPALWLKHNDDFPKARQLLDDYQQQRQITQRQLYLELKQAGQAKTLWMSFKENPFLFIVYFAVMSLIIYLSLKVLMELGLNFSG